MIYCPGNTTDLLFTVSTGPESPEIAPIFLGRSVLEKYRNSTRRSRIFPFIPSILFKVARKSCNLLHIDSRCSIRPLGCHQCAWNFVVTYVWCIILRFAREFKLFRILSLNGHLEKSGLQTHQSLDSQKISQENYSQFNSIFADSNENPLTLRGLALNN